MKIVGLSYKIEQKVITSDYIESILKEMHLFKDVMLASKLYVIRASLKLNIVVVWVNIWDFIITIRGMNINLDVLQYKNY